VRCKFEDGAPCKSDADCINGSCLTSYRDADGDGYGGAMVVRCERAPALGYVTAGGDCCDSDPATHPGVTTFSSASNACHGFDRNCDGKVERSDGSTATCGCFGPTGGKLAGQICTSCR
jgi:hypothetical protein